MSRPHPDSTPPIDLRAPPWALPLLLAALATLGPFSVDTYMPSFPAIAESLRASPIQMQQTLSVYLLAFSLMMLLHGTLSDSFGRRPVILVSLVVFFFASVGCAVSFDIATLLFFRALQGISAGGGMIVGRAVIRDRFEGHQAQRIMSHVTMMFGIAPAIAPIIGGWLHVLFGWHSVFVFMAILALLLFVLCSRYLSESLPRAARQPFSVAVLSATYRRVLGSRSFLLLAFAVGFNFSAFFLYIASAPAFVLKLLRLRETEFAWLFIAGIAGIMLGAFLSGRFAGRMTQVRTVRAGYALMASAAAVNILYNFTAPLSVPWAVLPITVYTIGMSLAMPSISIIVMDLFPSTRGMAASLQGFVSTFMNSVVAGLVSPFLSGSGRSLALGMAAILAAGFVCWALFERLGSVEPSYV
jgi:MFS transporter, DHA1 family, multidrug resistance protein